MILLGFPTSTWPKWVTFRKVASLEFPVRLAQVYPVRANVTVCVTLGRGLVKPVSLRSFLKLVSLFTSQVSWQSPGGNDSIPGNGLTHQEADSLDKTAFVSMMLWQM